MKKILLALLCISGIFNDSFSQTYLPLTGGTLSGNLAGTNASFTNLNVGITAPPWAVFNHMVNMLGGAIGGTSSTDFRLMSNLYYDGGAYRLRNNGASTMLTLGSGELYFYNSSSGNAEDAAIQSLKFMVGSSGKVGIGTGDPIRTLDVFSSTNPGITIGGSAANTVGRGLVFTNNTDNVAGLIEVIPNTTGTNSAMSIYVGGASTGDDKMWILDNGNIGIGTSNASDKLTVAGKIHSQEVKVTTDAGADSVFEDEYKLRSLSETEAFIRQNKHLPEIAPAKEMVKEGINLGEMNVKLLQKIEELTLYLINQSKDIELLKLANFKQEKEILELRSSR